MLSLDLFRITSAVAGPAHGSIPPGLPWWQAWSFDPSLIIPVALVGWFYLRGLRRWRLSDQRLRGRHRKARSREPGRQNKALPHVRLFSRRAACLTFPRPAGVRKRPALASRRRLR